MSESPRTHTGASSVQKTNARAATITEVAAKAGVSYQTVSNVMNAPEKVKAETLARVQQAMAALQYVPNIAARQMRSSKSFNLAYRLSPQHDGISGAILDTFLHALTETAQNAGYRILLITARSAAEETQRYLDLKGQNQIDGVVLASTHRGDERTTALLDAGLPFATFGRPWGAEALHAWVDVDGAAGTFEGTSKLIELGHRRIGFIGWPAGSGAGDDRHLGWAQAMGEQTDASPKELHQLRLMTPDGVEQGAEAAKALISDGATAIVCASDSLALGAVTWAGAHRPPVVPNIVGFDDTVVSRALNFSSIRQPVTAAAVHCFSLVTKPASKTSNHLLQPLFVNRGLTAQH